MYQSSLESNVVSEVSDDEVDSLDSEELVSDIESLTENDSDW